MHQNISINSSTCGVKLASAKDFKPDEMRDKYGDNDCYLSPAAKPAAFPSLAFYSQLALGPVPWLFGKAAHGQCDDNAWIYGSAWCGDILENIGCSIDIRGMANLTRIKGPCVFIANHMSTLETFLLPGMIRPRMKLTFVVKRSLVKLPLFGPVMRSRDPVVVDRVNPRADLQAVLDGGLERLRKGISIVVFPQSTRSLMFEPEHFNTIGVKLARKADVPVIPIVLKTDVWGQGSRIKELGKVRPALPARFLFGEPISIEGNGKGEHAMIRDFIGDTLGAWQAKDGINK